MMTRGFDEDVAKRLAQAMVTLYRTEAYLPIMEHRLSTEFGIDAETSWAIFRAMDQAYDDGCASND